MSKHPKDDLPKLLLWEGIAAFPALVLAAILLYQRNLVFDQAIWGLFNDNVGPLVVWAVVAGAILLATKPWNEKSQFGSQLRMFSLLCSKWSLFFLILVILPYGRYRIIRFESLYLDFGIAHYQSRHSRDFDLVGWEVTKEIVSAKTGPHILRDVPLMKHFAGSHGPSFLLKPQAARLLYGALKKNGVDFQEIWADERYRTFLLACLQAEANPQPWVGMSWSEEHVSPAAGNLILEPQQRKQVCRWFFEQRDKLDLTTSQSLIFVALNFPKLLDPGEHDLLMESWAKKFKTLESLAVNGLMVREDLKDFLGDTRTLKVKLEPEGFVQLDSITSSNLKPYSVPQMVLGLIRSCGVEAEEVDDESADLVVSVKQTSKAIYNYESPTYTYQTDYEQRTTRVGKYGSRTRSVPVQRQVRTGSEKKTQYGPVLTLTFREGEQTLHLPETLLYWHHLTYDHENGRYLDAGEESRYGRMWPFGLDEDLFKHEFLTHRESY